MLKTNVQFTAETFILISRFSNNPHNGAQELIIPRELVDKVHSRKSNDFPAAQRAPRPFFPIPGTVLSITRVLLAKMTAITLYRSRLIYSGSRFSSSAKSFFFSLDIVAIFQLIRLFQQSRYDYLHYRNNRSYKCDIILVEYLQWMDCGGIKKFVEVQLCASEERDTIIRQHIFIISVYISGDLAKR